MANELKYLKFELFLTLDIELLKLKEKMKKQLDEHKETTPIGQNLMHSKSDIKKKTGNFKDADYP